MKLKSIQGGKLADGKTVTKVKKLPSVLRQYLEIKEQHQNSILFFQVGDFYEMFFDDAEVASKILGLTLISRNKKNEGKIPVCGVPVHAAFQHIRELVRTGNRVAVCNQIAITNTPRVTVKREISHIFNPNEILEEYLKKGIKKSDVPEIINEILHTAITRLEKLLNPAVQMMEQQQENIIKEVVGSISDIHRVVYLASEENTINY